MKNDPRLVGCLPDQSRCFLQVLVEILLSRLQYLSIGVPDQTAVMFKAMQWILLSFAFVVVLRPYLAECKCRMDPDSAHTKCGLPEELSNFQGENLVN